MAESQRTSLLRNRRPRVSRTLSGHPRTGGNGDEDRRHPAAGPQLLVRVRSAPDRADGAHAGADARRSRAARAVVRVGHLRRGWVDPRTHPRPRRADPARDRDDPDGAPHLRLSHPGRPRRRRRAVPRRRDREHPRPRGRPAQGPRPPPRRADLCGRAGAARAGDRRLLDRRRRAPGAAPPITVEGRRPPPHGREARARPTSRSPSSSSMPTTTSTSSRVSPRTGSTSRSSPGSCRRRASPGSSA